ncbi:hypothetical protein PCE1_003879 [Barthelona sp. PCE]
MIMLDYIKQIAPFVHPHITIELLKQLDNSTDKEVTDIIGQYSFSEEAPSMPPSDVLAKMPSPKVFALSQAYFKAQQYTECLELIDLVIARKEANIPPQFVTSITWGKLCCEIMLKKTDIETDLNDLFSENQPIPYLSALHWCLIPCFLTCKNEPLFTRLSLPPIQQLIHLNPHLERFLLLLGIHTGDMNGPLTFSTSDDIVVQFFQRFLAGEIDEEDEDVSFEEVVVPSIRSDPILRYCGLVDSVVESARKVVTDVEEFIENGGNYPTTLSSFVLEHFDMDSDEEN